MPSADKNSEPLLLTTDDDTFDGESAYDIGLRHGREDHEYYPDRLPKGERRAYSRGYARGQIERNKEDTRD